MSQPGHNGHLHRGRVKMFDDDKGFGFIITDDGGPDVFFHRSDLADGSNRRTTIASETRVTFEPCMGKRGPKATNVKVIRA